MHRTVRERIGKFTFIVRPTVFNPVDYISSRIFADFVLTLDLNGRTVMDMGCGSGIISIIAASKGANCLAADINPIAVHSVKESAEINRLSGRINALESDLFESVPLSGEGSYEVIFFNPPYYKGIPKNNFERAFKAGPDLEVISNFLLSARRYLMPGGLVFFIVSSDMDLDDLKSRIKANGFGFEICKTIRKLLETFYIIESVVI